MLRLPLALLLGSSVLLSAAETRAWQVETPGQSPSRRLRIGTHQSPPFAIKLPDGSWSGISIELWQEIAEENDWDCTFREINLDALKDAIESGEIDAVVAGITVTHDRELWLDFSHPFYSSGLGIAIRKMHRQNWTAGLWQMLAWPFVALLAFLSTATVCMGIAIWLIERRRNPEHFGGKLTGLGHGIWWAVVTMTTVGYGDKAPQTLPGRLIATFWMLFGAISLAVITGTISSHLTVTRLTSPIRGPDDLPHVRAATVSGSSSELELLRRGISFRGYATEHEALDALANQQVDAVVYDAPVLRYITHHEFFGTAEVLPLRFHTQEYAIALPSNSSLREPINRSLTRIVDDPKWEDTLRRYLGRQ
ncbi:MAG: transporter substrate-binding domain-containing protein [Planctomycetales bacterium]|nr:transporter substrate-binding domain-containing protein [Planctomycetales bacterium]